ncbi:MAG: hypothetical protein AAF721_28400 [Myxococcota bacterium]
MTRATIGLWVATAAVAACASSGSAVQRNADPRCRAQVCHSDDGGCDAIVVRGFAWNGSACRRAEDSGCGAVGADCGALFETLDACERAHQGC